MRRVTVTKDRVAEVVGSVKKLTGKAVLVGIPESTTSRADEEGAPITNAALGYIHEFGAPGANIPARPFLIPGVRKATRDYMPHLKAAATAALDANQSKADKELNAAGLIASAAAKQEITTGNFAPLQPSTIRARARQRGTKSQRASEKRYLDLVAAGTPPDQAQTAVGIHPLINTGQLRNSLTYVVRKGK